MKKKLTTSLPKWVNPSLQALAFWIAYKKQLYQHHPIKEGAIVLELLGLISSNIDNKVYTHSEVQYRSNNKNNLADIVLADSPLRKNLSYKEILSIIEVKRDKSKTKINPDIERLGKYKIENPQVRCFLIVVSESKRPNRFVGNNGEALGIIEKSEWNDYKVNVRRVCKATSSFRDNNVEKAHYVCLIEIQL